MLPLADTARPIAIMAAPNMTVDAHADALGHLAHEDAAGPVPSQVSARPAPPPGARVPRSSVIGFNPTTASSGEPYDTDSSARVSPAAIHEARDSMLAAGPVPERGAAAMPGPIAAGRVPTISVTRRPLLDADCPRFDQASGF